MTARAASLRLIQAAIDAGVTMFDTADIYGFGENESLLGDVLKTTAQTVVVATKCGIVRHGSSNALTVDGRPKHITAACEASLRRLGVDHIDLFYLHRVDPGVPVEDSVGAMAELVHAGKVSHLGLCEASEDTLARAATIHRLAALQSEWSLWTRDVESGVLACARGLGIGIVAYSPLGRGFFANQRNNWNDLDASDFRRQGARYAGPNLAHNEFVLARLRGIADELNLTVSQLALAWLLGQGEDVVPIPGIGSPAHLSENLVSETVRLSSERLRELSDLVRPDVWAGERYPADTYLTYSTTPPRCVDH
jgi:aryl-alcohol dehydrogenase-like predicted oxidoreductase